MRIMPRGHGGAGATGAGPTSTRAIWFISLYISLCVGMRTMPRGHGGAGATGAVPTLYISLYRNEDNAPRARRRRRYGCGPNTARTLVF